MQNQKTKNNSSLTIKGLYNSLDVYEVFSLPYYDIRSDMLTSKMNNFSLYYKTRKVAPIAICDAGKS